MECSVAATMLEHALEPRLVCIEEPYDGVPHGLRQRLILGSEHAAEAHPLAWVVGDEPVVVVDWFGASNYAKSS